MLGEDLAEWEPVEKRGRDEPPISGDVVRRGRPRRFADPEPEEMTIDSYTRAAHADRGRSSLADLDRANRIAGSAASHESRRCNSLTASRIVAGDMAKDMWGLDMVDAGDQLMLYSAAGQAAKCAIRSMDLMRHCGRTFYSSPDSDGWCRLARGTLQDMLVRTLNRSTTQPFRSISKGMMMRIVSEVIDNFEPPDAASVNLIPVIQAENFLIRNDPATGTPVYCAMRELAEDEVVVCEIPMRIDIEAGSTRREELDKGAPMWKSFIESLIPQADERASLQAALASRFWSSHHLDAGKVLAGPTGAGKSLLPKCIEKVFGRENCGSISFSAFARHDTQGAIALYDAQEKFIILIDDLVSSGAAIQDSESLRVALTGGSLLLRAHYEMGHQYAFKNLWLFITNELLTQAQLTPALDRRLDRISAQHSTNISVHRSGHAVSVLFDMCMFNVLHWCLSGYVQAEPWRCGKVLSSVLLSVELAQGFDRVNDKLRYTGSNDDRVRLDAILSAFELDSVEAADHVRIQIASLPCYRYCGASGRSMVHGYRLI